MYQRIKISGVSAFGITAMMAIVGGTGAEAAGGSLKRLIPQAPITHVQYQADAVGQVKPMDETFIREKCDDLAGKAGLPKELQDMKLIYPGLNLTFAEFLCGAFASGVPIKINAHLEDSQDSAVIRIQMKMFDIDFRRGRLLADGQTFVGVDSPISGGIPALSFFEMSNSETGESDSDSSNLVILDETWQPQMQAYLRQEQQR